MRKLLAVFSLILSAYGIGYAEGPNVGKTCQASWTAVTTYTDGSTIPASAPVSYNLYVANGVIANPVGPANFTGISGTSFTGACANLTQGQYTLWVSAVSAGIESSVSTPFPFVLVIPTLPPNHPTGVSVR